MKGKENLCDVIVRSVREQIECNKTSSKRDYGYLNNFWNYYLHDDIIPLDYLVRRVKDKVDHGPTGEDEKINSGMLTAVSVAIAIGGFAVQSPVVYVVGLCGVVVSYLIDGSEKHKKKRPKYKLEKIDDETWVDGLEACREQVMGLLETAYD